MALIDSFTDEVVQYNPEFSAKVEIVVLEGDFDGDEETAVSYCSQRVEAFLLVITLALEQHCG